jgi:anti-sigma factor (TIGR02949 family)
MAEPPSKPACLTSKKIDFHAGVFPVSFVYSFKKEMAMDCKKVLSRLHAYLDGEVPAELMQDIEKHLSTCPSCLSQVERIRQVHDMLDGLSVPPLPQEFAARIMAKAQREVPFAKEKRPLLSLDWRPFQWLLDLSAPMRLAACAVVFLACLLGISMSKELSLSGNRQNLVAQTENIDGFEWFSPTPPASLGSAYLALALVTPGDQSAR